MRPRGILTIVVAGVAAAVLVVLGLADVGCTQFAMVDTPSGPAQQTGGCFVPTALYAKHWLYLAAIAVVGLGTWLALSPWGRDPGRRAEGAQHLPDRLVRTRSHRTLTSGPRFPHR